MFKIHFGPSTEGKKAKGLKIYLLSSSSFAFSFDTLSLSFGKGFKVSRKTITSFSYLGCGK